MLYSTTLYDKVRWNDICPRPFGKSASTLDKIKLHPIYLTQPHQVYVTFKGRKPELPEWPFFDAIQLDKRYLKFTSLKFVCFPPTSILDSLDVRRKPVPLGVVIKS